MAGYDIAGQQQMPDFLGTTQRSLLVGSQMRGAREARNDAQTVRGLAPNILAGDPAAFDQAAAIDPQAAGQYQAAGDNQLRRLKGAIAYIEQAQKAGNPQAVETAYQQVRPYLAKFGQQPPATFAEAADKFEAAKARIAMLDAQNPAAEPTGFREAHMKAVAAGYQPGSAEYQRAMRVSLGTEAGLARTQPKTITTDINGVPTTLTFDPGTQSYRIAEITGAGQAPPARQVVGPDGRPLDLSGIDDPRMRAEIEDNPALWQVAPDGAEVRMPDQRPPAGVPILGRTKEAEAAAVEAAKQSAQLEYLPEQERIKRESAIAQASGVATATKQAEVDAKQGQKARDAQATLGLLDEAERILPGATGGGAGAATDRVAGVLGISTPGAQATAQLNLIAAQLVAKVPRFEGPQSNIDVQFYREAAGDLANPNLPVATRLAALRTMRALSEKAAGGASASPQQSAARPQSQADFDALPSGSTYIDPDDGRTYRKP